MAVKNKAIEGVWTAIATPFSKDGNIDWQGYEKLLKFQEKNGVQGIVVCGTTGESPTLTDDEKIELIRFTRKTLPSHIGVMAGTGTNNTKQTIDVSLKAKKAGAESLLIVTPPYNKPNQKGLLLHYNEISERVELPICLYHVPGRTNQKLSPDNLAELCAISNVTTVKEASADLTFFSKTLLMTQATFLSGDDYTYLPSLAIGGKGVISVVSNVFPDAMIKMTAAFLKGNIALALQYHNSLMPIIDALFIETNPCPLKAALHSEGFIENKLRLPLATVSDKNYQFIQSTVDKTKEALRRLSNGH